ADRYSLRDRLIGVPDARTPVMCHPHMWDGVSYYLQRNDVQVFSADQLGAMVDAIERQPTSLVIIKEDAALSRFLDALPESREFILHRRQHPVAVGWVRERYPAPTTAPPSASAASAPADR